MKLKWTRKKPMGNGYYWYRKNHSFRTLVRVFKADELRAVFISHIYSSPTPLKQWRGSWAGPLPEPPKD